MNVDRIASRIRAFERELVGRCSTSAIETPLGTAFVHEAFPLRYDSNFLWVDPSTGPTDVDALVAEADRTLGGRGLRHREVRVDDQEQGRRLSPGLVERGWRADRCLTMAQTRPAEPRPVAPVRETDFEGARSIAAEAFGREREGESDEAVDQVVGFRAVLERAVGARFFVADVDDRPAAVCDLYVLGDVAQIEDVYTLEEYRGRGLAGAVVLAATAAARARGCDVLFLVADEDDWPKELYRRLGFDPVDRFWSFLREPEPATGQRV